MAREILVLRKLDHPNVVKLEGLVTSRMSCSLYLVFEYMEHDLAGLVACQGVKFTEPQVSFHWFGAKWILCVCFSFQGWFYVSGCTVEFAVSLFNLGILVVMWLCLSFRFWLSLSFGCYWQTFHGAVYWVPCIVGDTSKSLFHVIFLCLKLTYHMMACLYYFGRENS